MTDNRFKDFPVDARFPSLGRDVRFEDFPTDKRFTGGLDTRFQGPAYGGGGEIPVITGVPTISGTATVGSVLTASPAPVTGDPTPTRTWQWYRGGVAIGGATSITYTLVLADSGATITVEQIETNTEGFDTAVSAGVAVAFTPASLFTSGEVGTWLRPNNASTVYQESTGSTAGVVNQPVGLMHDLSKGMALGPNLVSNPGPFTNTTGWTAQRSATLSVVSSKLRIASGAMTFPFASSPCTTVVGTFYEFLATAQFVAGTDDDVFLEKADSATSAINVVSSPQGGGRTVRLFVPATATTTFVRLITRSQAFADVYDWDNIILRSVAGVPALQAAADDRPILREGGNGVRFIENVSADALNWTAPAGTYTVAYVIPDGTVTILTGQSLSGATNIMLASQIVEYVAVNRALTGGETSGLTAYLQGVANP